MPMQALALQRCSNHLDREAVARCPECGRFYCRECITEHEERVLCAACLQSLVRQRAAPRRNRWLAQSLPLANALVGLVVAWICFFLLGRLLVSIPSQFHSRLWERTYEAIQPDNE